MKQLILVAAMGLALQAMGQTKTTEIWLLDVINKEGKVSVSAPQRITQNEHYDNQPCFSRDGSLLWFASMPDTIQSDIFEYNLKKKITRQVTSTPESEYQPQPIPYARDKFSVIRVELEKAQRFYEYSFDASYMDILMPNEDSLAYYCWMNDTTVGAYMLNGRGGSLQQFDMKPQQAIILMEGGFGRCLARVPGTSNLSYVQKGSDGVNTLMVFDMSTEERNPHCTLPQGVEDFCWGPDGRIWCSDQGKLFSYNSKKEGAIWEMVADLNEKTGSFYRLAMNPAGDKMAIVSYKGDKP